MIVKVTFPETYHAENLAGKDAQFHCQIHEIRVKTAYELDDVFAKEVGQCDTLEEMRQKLQQSLQAYADDRGEMDLQDQLLRQAAATLEFSAMPEQIEKEIDAQMQALQAQLARQGLSLEMYCSFMSTTEEDLRRDARPAAEHSLRSRAAIDKIVELEGLQASQQELGEAIALICHQNGMTVEQLQPYYDDEFEQAVTRSVLTSKAMRLIRDAANVTVV